MKSNLKLKDDFMVYFLSIPIMFLLWHSAYILTEKYDRAGKVPVWFHMYIYFVAAYIFISPIFAIYSLLEVLNTNDTVKIGVSCVVGFVAFLLFLMNSSKRKEKDPQ